MSDEEDVTEVGEDDAEVGEDDTEVGGEQAECDYFERIKFERPVTVNPHPVRVGDTQKANKGAAAKKSAQALRRDEYIEDYKSRKSRFQTFKETLTNTLNCINIQCGREVIVCITPQYNKYTSAPPLEINLPARHSYSMSKKLVDNTEQYNVGFKVDTVTARRQIRNSDRIMYSSKDRKRQEQRNETINTFTSPSRPRYIRGSPESPDRRTPSPSSRPSPESTHRRTRSPSSPSPESTHRRTRSPSSPSPESTHRRIRSPSPSRPESPDRTPSSSSLSRPPPSLRDSVGQHISASRPQIPSRLLAMFGMTPSLRQKSSDHREKRRDSNVKNLSPPSEECRQKAVASSVRRLPEMGPQSGVETLQEELRRQDDPSHQSGFTENADFHGDELQINSSFQNFDESNLYQDSSQDSDRHSQVQSQLSNGQLNIMGEKSLNCDSDSSSPLDLSSVCQPSVSSVSVSSVGDKTEYNSHGQNVDGITENNSFAKVCSISEIIRFGDHVKTSKKNSTSKAGTQHVMEVSNEIIFEAPEFNQFKENVEPSNEIINYASLNGNKDVAILTDKNLNTNDSIDTNARDDCNGNTNANLLKRQLSLESPQRVPLKKRPISTNNELKKPTSWRQSIAPVPTPNVTISNLPRAKQPTVRSPVLDESKIGIFDCRICKAAEKTPQDRAHKMDKGTWVPTSYFHSWIACETEVEECTYWAHCSCLYENNQISKKVKTKRDLEKLIFLCPEHVSKDLNLGKSD